MLQDHSVSQLDMHLGPLVWLLGPVPRPSGLAQPPWDLPGCIRINRKHESLGVSGIAPPTPSLPPVYLTCYLSCGLLFCSCHDCCPGDRLLGKPQHPRGSGVSGETESNINYYPIM